MDLQVKIECTVSLDKVFDVYKCNLTLRNVNTRIPGRLIQNVCMHVFSEHEEVVYMPIDTHYLYI